jgi:hypothetical protein
MKFVTLYIGGVEKFFVRVHYVKSHPSSDPDTFDIVLTPEQMTGIDNFDIVEIKKDGNTEFYGFVEEITPEIGDDGLEYLVSGRCWKVILWKKWTERYQESREVGPYNSEHDVIESGFFGSVNPTELLKFIMRCPMSVHPKDKIRHKIGWGIPSDDWTYCANITADCFYPDWVGMRTTGLSWRSRGSISNLNSVDLLVNYFGVDYTDWLVEGTSPYIHTDNTTDNIHIFYPPANSKEGKFGFQNLTGTAVNVNKVSLFVKAMVPGNYTNCFVFLNDGITTYNIGSLIAAGYGTRTKEFNVINILNTVAKVNDATIYFEYDFGYPSSAVYVYYAFLRVEYSTTNDLDIYQHINDYFIINLADFYPRVTGILLECRNNIANYARNYNIQWTSLSDCCGVAGGTWNDFDPPVVVQNNEYRDILHSWKPEDDVHCIRIKLTLSADNAWEISQAYVWQGDEHNYRVMHEV